MADSNKNEGPDFDPSRIRSSTYEDSDGNTQTSEVELPPEGAANDGAYDHVPHHTSGMTDEDWENHESNQDVLEYVEWVKRWKSVDEVSDGDGGTRKKTVAEDADLVESIKFERQRLADQILRLDGIYHPELADYKKYLNADFENLRKPDASEADYSEYMREEARLYEKAFGDENLVGAESYQRVTETIAESIAGEKDISDHYGLLRIRREAALQHFDDPRFIAGVALYKNGDLKDEMLVDFDRTDLYEGTNADRSRAMADVFAEEVALHHNKDEPVSAKVKSFQRMREQSKVMRTNQKAVMDFAEDLNKAKKHDQLELGLSALENVTYSDPVFNKWFKSFDDPKAAHNLKRSHLAIFDAACKRFEEEFDKNDPRAALSFAVMERSGQAINKSMKLSRQAATEGVLEHGGPALNLFSDRWIDEKVNPIADEFESKVLVKMGGAKLRGEKSGEVVVGEVEEGGKKKLQKLELAKATSFDVVDGGHIKVTDSDGKAQVFKLGGMDAPKIGIQTRSGRLDAGENAKRHLETFFTRYGADKLTMDIVANDKGETFLKARLPSGEDLSQRMIKDGYAAPNDEVGNSVMREAMANQAQSVRRGLWAEGFVDTSEDWRSEKSGPALSDKDKREDLTDLVGKSTATTASQAYRFLSRPSTKLFGLPVEEWSNSHTIDEKIQDIANRQPARLENIYGQNMEVLRDLRKRKDKLTNEEKHAHDRLSLGRRAIAKALINTGHMTEEQSRKDSHPLMSRESKTIDPKYLRMLGNATADIGAAGYEIGSAVAKKGSRAALDMLNTAMEPPGYG